MQDAGSLGSAALNHNTARPTATLGRPTVRLSLTFVRAVSARAPPTDGHRTVAASSSVITALTSAARVPRSGRLFFIRASLDVPLVSTDAVILRELPDRAVGLEEFARNESNS